MLSDFKAEISRYQDIEKEIKLMPEKYVVGHGTLQMMSGRYKPTHFYELPTIAQPNLLCLQRVLGSFSVYSSVCFDSQCQKWLLQL